MYVMGERAARLEPATPEDIAQMRHLAAEAVRAGAIGFSTSRSINHKSIKGDPTPTLRATEAELTGIAMGLADAGKGVFQFISVRRASLEEEFAMLRRVAAASGRPMSFTLLQRHSPTASGQPTARTHARGGRGPDPRPGGGRPVGVPGCRAAIRSYLSVLQGDCGAAAGRTVARMRRPEARSCCAETSRPGHAGQFDGVRAIFPLGDVPNYEPAREHDRRDRTARARARTLPTTILRSDGRVLRSPFANCCLDAAALIADANTVIGFRGARMWA
jgi:hypothetical protein